MPLSPAPWLLRSSALRIFVAKPFVASMHSPTSPRTTTSSTLRFVPWRPWSIPADGVAIRRALCGLLNKVTSANIGRIADQFSLLAIRAERSGDASLVRSFGMMLVERCIRDPSRTTLMATLVQRAADESEGESLRWRSVDPYYLEDPSTNVSNALRAVLIEVLEAMSSHDRESEAWALSMLLGELLVRGALSVDDIQDTIHLLFKRTTEGSELSCIALCRILRRISASTEASHLVDALDLVGRIESVLEEDTISVRMRYMMMVGDSRALLLCSFRADTTCFRQCWTIAYTRDRQAFSVPTSTEMQDTASRTTLTLCQQTIYPRPCSCECLQMMSRMSVLEL